MMKQFQEAEQQNVNKMFLTPKKKKCQPKAPMQEIILEEDALNSFHDRFDLGTSPRYQRSSHIQLHGRRTPKNLSLSRSRGTTSPMVVTTYVTNYEQIHDEKQRSFKRIAKNNRSKHISQFGNLNIKENFQACYQAMLKKIQNGEDVNIPQPEIFSAENLDESIYTQLLTFTLNAKNSRGLIYNDITKTMDPVFQCMGCQLIFMKSSSLGGHLSRCKNKKLHYKKLIQYYDGCYRQNLQKQEQKQSFLPQLKNKKKKNIKKKSSFAKRQFKIMKKNKKLKQEKKKIKFFEEIKQQDNDQFAVFESSQDLKEKNYSQQIIIEKESPFNYQNQSQNLKNSQVDANTTKIRSLTKINQTALLQMHKKVARRLKFQIQSQNS